LDLFVGGRIVASQYPMPAPSFILRNDGGTFTDVTLQVCSQLSALGLVTAALWTDFDGDGLTDLLVAGEWMPITFLRNTGKKLENVTAKTGLAHTTGWWNSLTGADFDGDGDMDYVAGNLGLNNKYGASPETPVCTYAKDYDQNGRLDPILCYYLEGKQWPAHPRDVLVSQINGMRRRFLRYSDYGQAAYGDMFTREESAGAFVVQGERFASSYLENTGGGTFSIRNLPVAAQFAPVYGLAAGDFDHDGIIDVLLAGNSYASDPLTGWYDASIGLLLKGRGQGMFAPVPVTESGFCADKDVKGLALMIDSGGRQVALVASNNDSLRAFNIGRDILNKYVEPAVLENKVLITYGDGRQEWRELYYGSGYLSHSSRRLRVPQGVISVKLFTYAGRSREVKLAAGLAFR
jgi:hypothetical protein